LYSFSYKDTCFTPLQISGTLVTVNKLFRNLPVRKNYLNSGRRAAEELKRADNIAKSLAVIHPGLRVTFCHNKCLLWQKVACISLKQSVMQVAGHLISNNLKELVLRETEVSVQILLIYLLESESNIVIY
jgi:DNA mismatch repair ATPase MutL